MKTDLPCQLCGYIGKLEKHHLIPQSKCHSAKYQKSLIVDECNFLWICKQCHDQIHALFSNNDLRDHYNTEQKLLEAECFKKFLIWRKKHLDYSFSSTKMSNNVKRKK